MDRFERSARADIPKGYAPISSGPIRPDDLLFIWPGGGFARADDPSWQTRVDDASDAVLCLRRASFDGSGYTHQRTYKMPASNAG